MADPAFYPHRVSVVERRDTHISVVFLTGEFAYKLKKPIDFGFLDYRDLKTRQKMCELEVKLNQRMSRDVYIGVVPLSRKGDGFSLGDSGEVVEYAVKMKQLPDDASLANLVRAGKVAPDQMLQLGRRLAEFYSTAERGERIDGYGGAKVLEFNTEENFVQLAPFVGELLEKERFDFVMQSSRGFLRDRDLLFKHRVREGRICDGHGDLRAEHVYFLHGIQIIDCIEFNERFRYGDTAVDLAFLHMDLERLAAEGLSMAMLNGYTESSRDYGVYTLLDFYSCYRAIVKMKISCLSAAGLEESPRKREMKSRAVQYLGLAFRYAIQFSRPTLYILCGLPGTGKSTYAEKLHEIFDVPLFRSDEVRTQLPEYGEHGGPVPFGAGIYKPEMRRLIYSRLLSMAHDELKKGRSVILDATFSLRKSREEAVRLAGDLDSNILFLECICSRETILARLAGRGKGGSGQSDARPEHLEELTREFERLDDLPPELHGRIDTQTPIEANMGSILSGVYIKKRAQVEKSIAGL
jgi:hypothetical protein